MLTLFLEIAICLTHASRTMFYIHFVHLAMTQSNNTKTKSGFLAQNRTWFTSLITYVSVLFPALLVKKGEPPPNRA